MKKYTIVLFTFLCFTTIKLFSQKEIIRTETDIKGNITFQHYDTSINPKPLSQSKYFLRILLSMSDNDSMKLEKVITEKNYTDHLYQQYYKGYKVLFATYAVHAVNSTIDKVNGFFVNVGNVPTNIGVSEQRALSIALNFVNAKKYGWEDSFTLNLYKEQLKDSKATLFPKGELLICKDDSITHTYRLVYKFHIYAAQPLFDENVFVDAISGKIIAKQNLIKDINVPGTALTLYSGVRNITMDSYSTPTAFRLQETRIGPGGNTIIQTFNMQNGSNYNNAVDFNNNTANWINPDGSLDAHWVPNRFLIIGI